MKNILAKTLMMFVAVAALSLTSCSKDPDELLLGEWSTSNVQVSMTYMGQTMPMDLTKAFETFTFNEDGSCTIVGHEVEITEMGGIEILEAPLTATGTWSLDETDTHLTIIVEDEPIIFTVNTLEKKTCSLSSTESIYEDGVNLDITINVDLTK